jgi:hypothetical protein
MLMSALLPICLLICLLLGLAPWRVADAHKPSDAYLTLLAHEDRVSVRWDVALRDLDNELGLDANDDGALTWGEIRSRSADIDALVRPQLEVASGGQACRPVQTPASAAAPPSVLALDRHSDGTYAVLRFELHCAMPVADLDVRYRLFAQSDPTHRGIVNVQWASASASASSSAVLGPDHPQRHFDAHVSSRLETLREFVTEGIWHIWLGFDHILFLLSLLLPAVLIHAGSGRGGAGGALGAAGQDTSLRSAALDVLKIVTAFTLAHSITLSLAVLDVVSLPSRLVESGIALTVILASLNNLWPVFRARRWVAAFAFGLIHGFGFAAALKDLGLAPQSLALSLFGFNLGVELGQLAIVAVFLPLAFLARHTSFYRIGVFRFGSAAVALIALVWFVERAFDVDLGMFRI